MKFFETELKGAFIIELEPRRDERGLFVRTFCKREFAGINHTKEFVQFNQSVSLQKGTLRGLHFQVPPSAEIKLIRCVRGQVFDVIIDLRKDSPTFLEHIEVILSEEKMNMIYVPGGFAHGFQTLEDNCHMIYYHTEYYTPENERGLNFNDPALNILWPLEPVNVSEKDQIHPFIDHNFNGVII